MVVGEDSCLSCEMPSKVQEVATQKGMDGSDKEGGQSQWTNGVKGSCLFSGGL